MLDVKGKCTDSRYVLKYRPRGAQKIHLHQEATTVESGISAGYMMAAFTWLHFTDLHRNVAAQRTWFSDWQHRLLEDLAERHEKTKPWNAIVLTGDLTARGALEEFDKVDEFLGRVLTAIRKLQPENPVVVLAIPGNHDLTRPGPDNELMALFKGWNANPHAQKLFWQGKSPSALGLVKNAFQNYEKWWQRWVDFQTNNSVKFAPGMLPGDFAATINLGELSIGFLGLNTAFLQLDNENYERKLALTQLPQLPASTVEIVLRHL